MLRFFRRIRKGLIDSFSTRKYLLYAVGEILLVMIGILLALQVNNWNENRINHEKEKLAIQRLHEEAESIVTYLKEDIQTGKRWIREAKLSAKALSLSSLAGLDSSQFIVGIQGIGYYPSITPPRSVYNELNSNGMLLLIQSSLVRKKIDEFQSSLEYLSGQLNYFRQEVNNPEVLAPLDFYSIYDSTSWDKREIQFNLNELANNRMFITEHLKGLRDQIVFQRFRLNVLEDAIEMCKALASEINESCTSITE